MDADAAAKLLEKRRARAATNALVDGFTGEWFREQRNFFNDPAQLVAAIDGRRAGKTRGGNRHFVRSAMKQEHGRFLYLNSTLDECRKLAWVGARGDGMKSLVERYKLPAVCHDQTLTIEFPEIDSWIYMRGAEHEDDVTKALGLPYHEVWWDEAQKIPPKLAPTIRDTLLPTLLDYEGRFRMTGTPVRNMSGLFWEVTQPNLALRQRGWSVHHWNLMSNPYWGRAESRDGKVYIVALVNKVVSGPHDPNDFTELEALVRDARHKYGMLALQELLGGPEVAPLDSPTMRREGFGEWVYEDANFVYWAHKLRREELCFAPARRREDGFPDVMKAMSDLPGKKDGRDYFCAFGNDLGTRNAYAFTLYAWSLQDPILYEVASFKRPGLNYDQMGAHMREVGEQVRIGVTTADAGGGGKPAVMGWSLTWKDRYRLPIIEATKHNKYGAIQMFNTDLVGGRIKLREGGELLGEMLLHQWSSVVSSTGKMVEDPTTPHDVLDSSLYAHRESYHHRYRPEPEKPVPGSQEAVTREELELESAHCEQDDDATYGAYGAYR